MWGSSYTPAPVWRFLILMELGWISQTGIVPNRPQHSSYILTDRTRPHS
jgi:hypothetical protein